MVIVIGFLLVVFSIAVVVYPFLKRPLYSDTTASQDDENFEGERRIIYSDIDTLELEKRLGHIDDQEYHMRLRDYRLAAAATFRDQEALRSHQEKLIEYTEYLNEEVKQVQRSRRQAPGQVICPECGCPQLTGTICTSCGASQIN